MGEKRDGYKILNGDCLEWLDKYSERDIHLTFIELTSGYFAGDEAIRDSKGDRVHTQQSPVALLLRIILSSTLPGDIILDPFAGTGTTLLVAHQLKRNSIGIEVDSEYVKIIEDRLNCLRPADDIMKYYEYYAHTPNLMEIWSVEKTPLIAEQRRLF
jgi:site-specific DNA-methyltransferase (adenine-specific)